MPHAQQQILDAVRNGLAAAGTAAGASVYLDRMRTLGEQQLPAILVDEAPQGEDVDPPLAGRGEQRRFRVLVRAVVKDGEDAPAMARELGAQIERVLANPKFKAPRPGRMHMRASRHMPFGDGETPMAAREQLWETTYFLLRRDAPDQPS
ncbi:MAG: hypothetical protein EOO29_08385 [Comamonadaceae bacterium]|nr:MAG: hypothetical protein EOO29_08385 [Comamonadaceae bacterium]